MIISREVDINVNRYGLRVVIPVVQYDSGRQIIFNIVDAELPSGCTSNIFIKKPSGKSVYNSCTVSGNKVTVTLTNQSLSEYGFNDAQIQIIKGEEVVTSFGFILEVKQSNADNAVISKTESTFFQGIVNKAQAAATTAEKVLDSIPDDYSQMSTKVNTNTTAIATLNSRTKLSQVYTADDVNGFLKQLLDYTLTLGVGSYNIGVTWQNHYFCNVNASVYSATRCVAVVSPQPANASFVLVCEYNAGTYKYRKMETSELSVNLTNLQVTINPNDMFTSVPNRSYCRFVTRNYGDVYNVPDPSTSWTIDQYRDTENYGYQIARRTNDDVEYYRNIFAGTWNAWEKLPTRSEVNTNANAIATNTTAIATLKPKVDTNTTAIATLNNNLGGYKLVGYTASVVLNKAGEFIIPYPSGENFGTVYGIASATFLQGGYCLPNPPLTPSSTSPAYDIQAAVAFRLLSTGIAIYTGGAWGADSRDIYFVLICKT